MPVRSPCPPRSPTPLGTAREFPQCCGRRCRLRRSAAAVEVAASAIVDNVEFLFLPRPLLLRRLSSSWSAAAAAPGSLRHPAAEGIWSGSVISGLRWGRTGNGTAEGESAAAMVKSLRSDLSFRIASKTTVASPLPPHSISSFRSTIPIVAITRSLRPLTGFSTCARCSSSLSASQRRCSQLKPSLPPSTVEGYSWTIKGAFFFLLRRRRGRCRNRRRTSKLAPLRP